jgi:GT2 family glycosyltransferase
MLSIITITFNNHDELLKTLDSIPVDESIERVIINGGSDKRTAKFLETFEGKSLTEKDSGIAEAFNKGIINSTGEYIMFLNSGDVLIDQSYPQRAAEILDRKENVHFIHSNILFEDLTGETLFMHPAQKNLGRGMPYLHPSMIVRRSVFNEIGNFDESFSISMDFDFVVRMEKKGFKGNYLNEGAVVRMDGRGKSADKEFKAISECYRSLKKHNQINFKNFSGYSFRILLYAFRQIILKLVGKKFLGFLKKVKHRRESE